MARQLRVAEPRPVAESLCRPVTAACQPAAVQHGGRAGGAPGAATATICLLGWVLSVLELPVVVPVVLRPALGPGVDGPLGGVAHRRRVVQATDVHLVRELRLVRDRAPGLNIKPLHR